MKPLAFSRPMVLARRAGRKTQTRRLVRGQLPHSEFRIPNSSECPYGHPGDHLWVREDFQVLHKVGRNDFQLSVCYLADDTQAAVTLTDHEYALWAARKFPYRKTPARFMYRSLARDLPTLTALRIERLQDLTEADAIAEGIEPVGAGYRSYLHPGSDIQLTPRASFQELWTSIHGPESWTANPWVWVLELTPFKP